MIAFLSKASRLLHAILTFTYYVTFSSSTTRSSSGSKLIHNCSPNIKLGVFSSTDSHMHAVIELTPIIIDLDLSGH